MKSYEQPINLVRAGSFFLFLSLAVTVASLFLLKTKLSTQHKLILAHTRSLIPAERMNSALQGYVASERGYLLTGDPAFIERLHTADGEFKKYLAELSEWVQTAKGDQYLAKIIAADRDHQIAVNRLHVLRRKVGLNNTVIKTFQNEVYPKRQMLQNLVDSLVQYKEQELLRREEEAKFSNALTVTGIILLTIFSTLLLGILSILFSKKLVRLYNDARESERKIKDLARELSRSNVELERFASIASHDLRSPLQTIMNFGTLLERKVEDLGDKVAKQYLSYIISGTTRMRELVDDLLDYARVNHGERSFEKVCLNSIINDVKLTLRNEIEKSGTQIICNQLPEIFGDRIQLRQLFSNLISNAITYKSDEKPLIKITFSESAQEWLVSVLDNGIGVDMQYAEQIFLPFKRLHSYQERPGTGLGLPICRSVVERHGGRISLKSKTGKGAEFLIVFPKHQKTNHDQFQHSAHSTRVAHV